MNAHTTHTPLCEFCGVKNSIMRVGGPNGLFVCGDCAPAFPRPDRKLHPPQAIESEMPEWIAKDIYNSRISVQSGNARPESATAVIVWLADRRADLQSRLDAKDKEIAEAVRAEREECARLAEAERNYHGGYPINPLTGHRMRTDGDKIASAIRARASLPTPKQGDTNG